MHSLLSVTHHRVVRPLPRPSDAKRSRKVASRFGQLLT